MPSLNKVQLIGRLGKDPEQRFTPTGKKVTLFSLAVDRFWRGSEGDLKEATDWFYIEAWGKLGEICQQYLHKGSLVYLEGRLHTERYEKQGETRTSVRVVALQMQMLERKPDEAIPEPVEEESIPEE